MAQHENEPGEAAKRLAEEIKRLRARRVEPAPTGQSHRLHPGSTCPWPSAPSNLPSLDLVRALDAAFDADGALVRLRAAARQEQADRRAELCKHTAPPVNAESASRDNGKPSLAEVKRSQQDWLRVRQAAGVRGRELTELAAWLYPSGQRAPSGHVLAGAGWLLDEPVPLESVQLVWDDSPPPALCLGSFENVLPLTERGQVYSGYSRAVRDLARPRLLENRLSYRLASLSSASGLELGFGTTTFFQTFDLKQALAHEFKAAWLASGRSIPDWGALPLRTALGDPFDPSRVPMSPGVNTLTIRRGSTGEHRFVLHERDGGKVADGGGLCHVMPAGEFQPSSAEPPDIRNDFSLWRNIMREFSEEFLGNPEHDGSARGPIDYAHDEPFRSLEQARAGGGLRLWHYGLVIEPLELGPVQLTVAVVDDTVFDELFAAMVDTNDEGRVVGRADVPFTEEAVDRLDPRLSASALTLLRLTWRDRHLLLRA